MLDRSINVSEIWSLKPQKQMEEPKLDFYTVFTYKESSRLIEKLEKEASTIRLHKWMTDALRQITWGTCEAQFTDAQAQWQWSLWAAFYMLYQHVT